MQHIINLWNSLPQGITKAKNFAGFRKDILYDYQEYLELKGLRIFKKGLEVI